MKRKPARNPEVKRSVQRIQRVIERVNSLSDIEVSFGEQKRAQIAEILFSMIQEVEACK